MMFLQLHIHPTLKDWGFLCTFAVIKQANYHTNYEILLYKLSTIYVSRSYKRSIMTPFIPTLKR